jgi:hypothetical protein
MRAMPGEFSPDRLLVYSSGDGLARQSLLGACFSGYRCWLSGEAPGIRFSASTAMLRPRRRKRMAQRRRRKPMVQLQFITALRPVRAIPMPSRRRLGNSI